MAEGERYYGRPSFRSSVRLYSISAPVRHCISVCLSVCLSVCMITGCCDCVGLCHSGTCDKGFLPSLAHPLRRSSSSPSANSAHWARSGHHPLHSRSTSPADFAFPRTSDTSFSLCARHRERKLYFCSLALLPGDTLEGEG